MRSGALILKHPISKQTVFMLALLPFGWAAVNIVRVYLGDSHALGANPIEAFIRFSGDWAMRILLLTLAISPVAKLAHMPDLIRFRRMIGLFAFFYAFVHLMGYIGLDQIFYWVLIWEDIVKRNFITVGMITFLMMLPLAITSTKGMMRRLGGRRWRNLHRLVYPAGVLTIVHYYMMIKSDATEPVIYGLILTALLIARRVKKPRRKFTSAAPASP
jgi:methionine sulfoxide reductase heme-binding subunit